ncbi:nucleotidyltransferase domain-containing protein [Alicyclobacillus tolerans]|uniref:nucleotidyltransferase domain-containing protein n=1 Tax=Alicyclobacillus tolerans TaxID=90970 RepID=UPI003B78CA36
MTEIISALKLVYDSISASDITWALTGSLAFYIRGIDVSVGDIDIQTDKDGAYEIERSLMRYVIEPVEFRTAQKIRSHFGKLLVDGVSVEIMGDIEKLAPNGIWLSTPPLRSIIEEVNFGEMCIPLLNLEYEYQAYSLMGRTRKAEILKNWLNWY